jgi:hypothetical protein
MRLSVILAAALALGACSPPTYWRATAPASPAAPQGRCRAGAGPTNPIVTEWSASEKANLEALLRQGGVAVEYTGCDLRVLTQCRLSGYYAWQRTSPATESMEIRGEDELWAKLPLGAASLEGELSRTGKLKVQTRVSGQLRLEGADAASIPRTDACARATHVVGALSVGAFALQVDGAATGKAGVELPVASAGGKHERSQGVVRSAGDWESCGASTEDSPHRDCRSPIQVFLLPIPGRAAEEGPAGTVKVELVAADANQRWDVYYDDEVVCTTPCSRWLDPSHPLVLRGRDGGALGGYSLSVRDLGAAADGGPVQVVAGSLSGGKLLSGATLGGLGFMALFAGGFFALADCGDPATDPFADAGSCSGAKTSAAIGAIAMGVGAWLLFDSLPKAEVHASGPASRGWSSVTVGPGFVAGTF